MGRWYLAAAVIVGGIVAYEHRGEFGHLPGASKLTALLSHAEKPAGEKSAGEEAGREETAEEGGTGDDSDPFPSEGADRVDSAEDRIDPACTR